MNTWPPTYWDQLTKEEAHLLLGYAAMWGALLGIPTQMRRNVGGAWEPRATDERVLWLADDWLTPIPVEHRVKDLLYQPDPLVNPIPSSKAWAHRAS